MAQYLEIFHPFPEISEIILPLISLWNYPAHKNYPPHISGSLSPSEMDHTLSVQCVSLWINLLLTYHFVSHWILSAKQDVKNLKFTGNTKAPPVQDKDLPGLRTEEGAGTRGLGPAPHRAGPRVPEPAAVLQGTLPEPELSDTPGEPDR